MFMRVQKQKNGLDLLKKAISEQKDLREKCYYPRMAQLVVSLKVRKGMIIWRRTILRNESHYFS